MPVPWPHFLDYSVLRDGGSGCGRRGAVLDATIATDVLLREQFTSCTCFGGHQGLQDAQANIWCAPPADGRTFGVGPCTCTLRINTTGSPTDHHRSKKTQTRGLSGHP